MFSVDFPCVASFYKIFCISNKNTMMTACEYACVCMWRHLTLYSIKMEGQQMRMLVFSPCIHKISESVMDFFLQLMLIFIVTDIFRPLKSWYYKPMFSCRWQCMMVGRVLWRTVSSLDVCEQGCTQPTSCFLSHLANYICLFAE